MHPQVLKDWRGMRTKLDKWDLQGQARWKARMRSFLSKKKDLSRPAVADCLKAKRLANWHSILALDQGLLSVCGHGLSRFEAARPLCALPLGAERQMIPVDQLPEAILRSSAGRSYKSVIIKPDGTTELEGMYAGQRSVLHLVMGMGSIGWPTRAWALYSAHLRGERWVDFAHRRHNNVDNGINSAGSMRTTTVGKKLAPSTWTVQRSRTSSSSSCTPAWPTTCTGERCRRASVRLSTSVG